jgi:CheY-like chemotaxis protein/anti-sigma regulatory factor (Ser/Thr protein kinase)
MKRVLVVDDCAVDRMLAGEILRRDTGFTIDYAPSGEDALQQIERAAPDLVLTDLQMPHIDGLQLVSIVREKYPRVPVILMTSQGSEEIAFQALQLGAASYVPKTYLQDKLRDTVQKVLEAAVNESYYQKAMECLARSDRVFSLANDPALFTPLIVHFQEECVALGICNHADRVRLGVGLGEALANAMLHGNLELSSSLREMDADTYHTLAESRRREPPYRDRRIEVEVRLARGKAVFVIRDEGPGFDPTALPDPTDPANLEKVTGRGILLMQAFMDQVDFNVRGNEVTMVKLSGPNGKCRK